MNYTSEICVQIVIALLKEHGISKIVASPGSTNHTFIISVQDDPFFEVYSCVDERSAAYMACGMSVEGGEPVVLSCTAATASRNYFPALTEAYYRKIPILALTSTRTVCQVGNLVDQQIDRSVQPADTVRTSVNLPYVKDREDFWDCELKVNKAILELWRHGGGPVHINMPTRYSHDYNCVKLPKVRKIERIVAGDVLPSIPDGARVGINIGSHRPFSEELARLIDEFCEVFDAAVFCDHTSNFNGSHAVHYMRAAHQRYSDYSVNRPDVLIDMGEIGAWGRMTGSTTWRVSDDGEPRDFSRSLRYVYEMSEDEFFRRYVDSGGNRTNRNGYFNSLKRYDDLVRSVPVDLPFSNLYVASVLSSRVPQGAELHFGILNSLRSWCMFDLPKGVRCFSNTGGYGIDGCMSSMIGASLLRKDRIFIGVFGDLSFFYDMNVLGNRHISGNVRILLINNGLGEEFKLVTNHTHALGDAVNPYVAAEGHHGHKSKTVVKSYVESLGFRYLSAQDKSELMANMHEFLEFNVGDAPVVFEVFTEDALENEALMNILDAYKTTTGKTRRVVKHLLGERGINAVKDVLGKL